MNWLKDAIGGEIPSHFELEPTANAGSDPAAQEAAIEAAISGEAAFPEVNKPVYLGKHNHYGGEEYYLQVPNDDVESAKAAKYLLENPTEFFSA